MCHMEVLVLLEIVSFAPPLSHLSLAALFSPLIIIIMQTEYENRKET